MVLELVHCEEDIRAMLREAVELAPYLSFSAEDTAESSPLQRKKYRIHFQEEEGFRISFQEGGGEIAYHTRHALLRALLYALSLASAEEKNIVEHCAFSEFGMMFDLSRNAVLRVDTVKQLIRIAAYLGYSFVGLYLEDTIEVEGEPYFGYMRGRLSRTEIKELDDYAALFGISLRPFIQTLAHLNQITRYEEYQKSIDVNDILLPEDSRTEELLRHLIRSVAEAFRSRKINIGMDEAEMLGLGKYLRKHGYRNRQEIMQRHLKKVLEICREYGYTVQMWSDMFFRLAGDGAYYGSEEKPLSEVAVPEEVELGYWDYYSTEEAHYTENIRRHRKLTDRVAFVGGAWKWTGFVPHNRYSIAAGKAALGACRKAGISSVTITAWGDDGAEASAFSVLPTLYIDADIAYNSKMPEEAFRKLSGYSLQEFLLLDEVNPYCESGETHNNASKYLLYNDPLLGTFDSVLREDTAERFREVGEKLERVIRACEGSAFTYILETASCLALVLERKADLGKRIRSAYLAKDEKTLREITEQEIPLLLKRMEAFYASFRAQWNRENKSFGFEVQTVRLGGLMQRLKDVQEILRAYLRKEIPSVMELDEPVKPFHYFENNDIQSLNYNLWTDIVSTSKI